MPLCLCERHTEIKNCNHNKPIQILYLLSNAGRDTTESGTRDDRIWDVRRPNLGRETTESGARDDRIWDGVRHQVGNLDFLLSIQRFLQSGNHPPSGREMGMDSAFSGIK